MEGNRGFFGLPAELMSALGTVLGFALLGKLDYNQQNSLGSWLELIGQILESNAAQGQLLQAQQQGEDRALQTHFFSTETTYRN